MSDFVTDRFKDRYPDDEKPEIKTWTCVKCRREFVDPDDHPIAWTAVGIAMIQQKEHWLGPTEPVCSACAAESGIPSIDEESEV